MSQENVEIVKSLFAAWEEKDPQAAIDLIDPDVEFESGDDAFGAAGIAYHGTGIEDFQQLIASWFEGLEAVRFEPQHFIDSGAHVIVWVRVYGRGRGSGAPFAMNGAAVYTLREGHLIRLRLYGTLAAATGAVGL